MPKKLFKKVKKLSKEKRILKKLWMNLLMRLNKIKYLERILTYIKMKYLNNKT